MVGWSGTHFSPLRLRNRIIHILFSLENITNFHNGLSRFLERRGGGGGRVLTRRSKISFHRWKRQAEEWNEINFSHKGCLSRSRSRSLKNHYLSSLNNWQLVNVFSTLIKTFTSTEKFIFRFFHPHHHFPIIIFRFSGKASIFLSFEETSHKVNQKLVSRLRFN